jgi:DNA primase
MAPSAEVLAQQYAIQSAAADWFRGHVGQRWAAAYLDKRGLTESATEAHAGYAPSRPGQWTLLLDHLRGLGYADAAIETAGLATRSRRGQLIDRFRDRVVLPVLDEANRPIGFVGRKPGGDTNPDNPKYLNPTSTPLYEKSRVLYGLDAAAIAKLADGARAIIVEGPMDRLAIQLAAPDLVPVATCGTALTDAHLDLLAAHTSLDRVILGFDADSAGRKAALAAGRKLASRGVAAPDVEMFTAPAGTDPADIVASAGAERLAAALADPERHSTMFDLLVDERLDHFDWSTEGTPLRELPVAPHAAYDVTRFVAETIRERVTWPVEGFIDPAQIQRQLAHIADRTGVSLRELNAYMVSVVFPDDEEFEISEPVAADLDDGQVAAPDLRAMIDDDADLAHDVDDGRDSF